MIEQLKCFFWGHKESIIPYSFRGSWDKITHYQGCLRCKKQTGPGIWLNTEPGTYERVDN